MPAFAFGQQPAPLSPEFSWEPDPPSRPLRIRSVVSGAVRRARHDRIIPQNPAPDFPNVRPRVRRNARRCALIEFAIPRV